MAISRTFYRRSDDNKNWWHWRPKCLIFLSRGEKKKAGKTFITTLVSGSRPTTYALCPACLAEDERVKTGDKSVYVRRNTRPLFKRNPVTEVMVRRDDSA